MSRIRSIGKLLQVLVVVSFTSILSVYLVLICAVGCMAALEAERFLAEEDELPE